MENKESLQRELFEIQMQKEKGQLPWAVPFLRNPQ